MPAPCAMPAGGRSGRRSRSGSACSRRQNRNPVKLAPNGDLRWRGAVIGRLVKGEHLLRPGIRPVVGDGFDPSVRNRVAAKLESWLAAYSPFRLGAIAGSAPDGVGGHARALLYQLGEAGGHLPRRSLRSAIDGLTKNDRKALAALGIRLGAQRIYYRDLLRPRAQALLALLWAIRHDAGILKFRRLRPASKRSTACRAACCRPAAMSSRRARRCARTGSKRCGVRSPACRTARP